MPPNLVVPHGFEANYTLGFARGLKANGVRFVVLSDDSTAERLRSAGISERNLRGSQNPRRSRASKAFNLGRYYAALLREIWLHRGATIHFTGVFTSRLIWLEALVLPVWLRLCAGRYVHTAHNTLPHHRENSLVFRFAYRWIYRFPHHFVAHTPKIADQLAAGYGVPRRRISVISIGLNEEVPVSGLARGAAREKLGLPAAAGVALMVGKVEPYKGVDALIDAWPQVRADARLAIVGECPDRDYAERIAGAIEASPRRGDMVWHRGFAANETLSLWLRAADCVVLPYRQIYQSGVIFLCKRHGLPIVATDVGSLRDFIGPADGILVPAGSPAALAGGVDRFFSAREGFDRDEIVQRAQVYAWPAQCAALRPLYA